MASRIYDYEELPNNPSTKEVLDVFVNRSCIEYGIASTLTRFTVIELSPTKLAAVAVNFEIQNRSLLDLAFASDARARAEDLPPGETEVDELAWVQVARAGLRRMSKLVSPLKGLDHTSLLTEDAHLQKEIYNDMCARRVFGGTFDMSQDFDYSARVAAGEIALGDMVNLSVN